MGSTLTCVGRDEPSVAESEAAYHHYTRLYHWVHTCLTDQEFLQRESENEFQNVQKDANGNIGSEELWLLTQSYMNRCDCKDPHVVEELYRVCMTIEGKWGGVSRTSFPEYLVMVLNIIEKDLTEKVAKFAYHLPEKHYKITHPSSARNLNQFAQYQIAEATLQPSSSQYRVVAEADGYRVVNADGTTLSHNPDGMTVSPAPAAPVNAPQRPVSAQRPVPAATQPRVPVGAKMDVAPAVVYKEQDHQQQQQQMQERHAPRGAAKQDPDATSAENGSDIGVENMKRQILAGALQVGVYNGQLEVERKNLKLLVDVDPVTGQSVMKQLTISDEGGQPNASFQISDIIGISQGVTANIIDKPPPPDRVVAFQFLDGTLCIVFEDPDICRLAIKALKQLCQVPVYSC